MHFPDLPVSQASLEESRLWEALNQLIQKLSARRQVIFFLDDLHWADASTLGWIGFLTRRASSPAIILIGASRPVEPNSRLDSLLKALAHEEYLARLALTSLTSGETLALAKRYCPDNADKFSLWLEEFSEGNPYFVNELIRHAYHSSILKQDGSIDFDLLASSQTLPPTIENLILSRIIRLREEARHVLDVAAVIGREFDFAMLHKALSFEQPVYSENDILEAIDDLRMAVLVQPDIGEKYSFDHSLTMEVVLKNMGLPRKRSLHRLVAQALESYPEEQIHPLSGIISQHYAEGNIPGRAAIYAFRAGQYAMTLAAWQEAISYFESALHTAEDQNLAVDILNAEGTAFFHKGDFPRSTETFYRAAERSQEILDFSRLEKAYLGLNLSLMPQSRFSESSSIARELAENGPAELAVCAQFIWGASLSVESANPVEAEFHLRQAEKLLEKKPSASNQITRDHIKYQLAGTVGQQGRSSEAVALYREALAFVQKDPETLDLLRQVMLYNNLAYHLLLLGQPEALDFARQGIKLAQERGSLSHLPYLYSTSGEIALSQNDLDEAEDYFNRGLSLARQAPIPERIAGLTANLGLVAIRRGSGDSARQRLSEALDLAEELGVGHLAVRIRCWLAPIVTHDEAKRLLKEAHRIAEQSGFNELLLEIKELEKVSI